MAERKVDWRMQASYCMLQAKIGTWTCVSHGSYALLEY